MLGTIRGLLALALIAPLIVNADPLPRTFFPFIVGKALYFQTLTEIAFGLWAVLALRSPAYRVPRSWLPLIFGAYLAIAFLSALFGVSLQRSLWSTYERMQGVVALAHGFAYVLVLGSVYRSWNDWWTILNFNLSVGLLMSLLGVAQHFDFRVLDYLARSERLDITLGNSTYVGAYMLVNALIALGLLSRSLVLPKERGDSRGSERRRRRARRRSSDTQGLFSGPWMRVFWAGSIAVMTLLVLTVPSRGVFVVLVLVLAAFGLSYMLWPRPRDGWWQVFWGTTIAFALLMMYFSGTRGAFVGLVSGLLAFAVGYLLWGKIALARRASLALVGLVVVFALALVGARTTGLIEGTSNLLSRVAMTGVSDDSLRGRISSGLLGLRGFADRPLLGWGPENFTIAYDRHVTADVVSQSVTSFDQAHNKLIEELTTKGVLGFSGYMALWVYMLWVMARRVRHRSPEDQLFALFAGAGLAGYFVQNLFLFDTPGTVVQFLLLSGFVVFLDATPGAATPAGRDSRSREADANPPLIERLVPTFARLRRYSGSPVVQSQTSLSAALAVALMIVSVTIYYVNYGPYLGSTRILETLSRDITWDERLEVFDRTVDAFPPLANYPRIIMFNQLANNWTRLTQRDARTVLDAADRQGRDGLTSEPEEWRVYLSLAALYQQASSFDAGNAGCASALAGIYESATPLEPVYTKCARSLVERAAELAPERIEIQRLLIRQYMVEQNYDAAYAVIDRYLEKAPGAEDLLAPFRSEVDRAAGR